jgi:hypothetical protein
MQEHLTLNFWQQAVASLELSETLLPSPERFDFTEEEITDYVECLRSEAYFITGRSLLPRAMRVKMLDAIDSVMAKQLDPIWTLLYDEFWITAAQFSTLIERILGPDYKYVTGNYIFVIPNEDSASGWGPHRDVMHKKSLAADGLPEVMTFWTALTDATPLNSCLYCVPGSRDKNYPNNVQERSVENVKDIVCMAVSAGQTIGLNHSLLHWGSRSSKRGAERRVSFVFDVQRGDVPKYQEVTLDPRKPLSFEERAGYLGHVVPWLHKYGVKFAYKDLAIAGDFVRAYGEAINLRTDYLTDYPDIP